MPPSGSFVNMYLAELHFGNGYMEIGLLISSLRGWSIYTSVYLTGVDRKYIRAKKIDVFFVQFYTVCLLYSYVFSVRSGHGAEV